MKTCHIILLFVFVGLQSISMGQLSIGDWNSFSDTKHAKDVVSLDNSVFFLFDAALLEYDTKHNEYTTWTATNGLSDTRITAIGIHKQTKTICLGYENGNIDLIQNGRTTNIPDLKLSTIHSSKQVYAIQEHQDFLYLATQIGIIQIDPHKKIIKDSYYPNAGQLPILSLCFSQDSIFALSPTHLYRAKTMHPALASPDFWTIDSRLPIIENDQQQYSQIACWKDSLYVIKKTNLTNTDTVFLIRNVELFPILTSSQPIHAIQGLDELLIIHAYSKLVALTVNHSVSFSWDTYDFGQKINTNALVFFRDHYWLADRTNGAVKRSTNHSFQPLPFNGISRPYAHAMKWKDGVLFMVPGEKPNENTSPDPVLFYREDNTWHTIDTTNNPLWKAGNTWGNSSLSIHPQENYVALGSHSKTPISIVDITTGLVIDTFGMYNAPFAPDSDGLVDITDLDYDKEGNLWVINKHASPPLKMRDTQGGWHSIPIGIISADKTLQKIYCDNNGDIWLSVYDLGLVGYHPGSPKHSTNGSKSVLLDFVLPVNKSNIYNPTCFTMDINNMLWIGVDNGITILSDPAHSFDVTIGYQHMQYPKVAVGEEFDMTMGWTELTDIEIDGGNRKWIATRNDGLLLVSSNGSVVERHFTVHNSPLTTNHIIDVEIDHYTGDVFIVTERDFLLYRSDATNEDPTYSSVKVFPNPAYPEYDGPIAIQGIRYNSDVKITDIAGNIVYQTASNGGTATWNGKTTQGERVTTGVYLIWTASNLENVNGNNARYVGKVMVINN